MPSRIGSWGQLEPQVDHLLLERGVAAINHQIRETNLKTLARVSAI